MQVTHAAEHITHVVLGGKKNINFGISDDPAFFEILSSALYKRPTLAMVRETICNAWDAHIEAGISHRPIVITLTDEYLIIKDFGKGIPDALIGPIYGVYGASTKKNDGRQTGGFGLGCKSPFAYTDHFEVTSCHQGIKTTYNMSKSSGTTTGKPAIVPIASFPTSETGITVKIPVKKGENLNYLIQQVVFNGDILVQYNSEALQTIGLDTAESGLVMLTEGNHTHITEVINVRYGNVIYPVESHQSYNEMFQQVYKLVKTRYKSRLVMQAPADSLSITPSREALTQTDITNETIQGLLAKFLSVFIRNQRVMVRHKEFINQYVDEAADLERKLVDRIQPGIWAIPGIPDRHDLSILKSTDDFAKVEVLIRYSNNRTLNAKDWFLNLRRYFYRVNQKKEFDDGLFHNWCRWMQKHLKRYSSKDNWGHITPNRAIATQWWLRQIATPLMLKLTDSIPNFSRHQFRYFSPFMINSDSYYSSVPEKPMTFGKVMIGDHSCNLIHLLKPTVILVHNVDNVLKRIQNLGRARSWSTGTMQKGVFFVYEVGRKKEVLAEVQEAFKNLDGIEFIDMTGRLEYEELAYQERQAKIAQARADLAAGKQTTVKVPMVKKVKPGMVCLSNLLSNGRIHTPLFTTNTDPTRIVSPDAVMVISIAKEKENWTHEFNYEVFPSVAALYGDKIAVSNKSDAIERAIEKGAMKASDYVIDKIMHDVENLPSLVAYHGTDWDKIKAYLEEKVNWDVREEYVGVMKLIVHRPELAHLVPSITQLSDEDRFRWTIWQNLHGIADSREKRVEIQTLKEKVGAIPLNPAVITMLDKFMENELVSAVHPDQLRKLWRSTEKDPIVQAKVIAFITTLLN